MALAELGKTRLMIEVAKALREQGWSAGFLARPGSGDQPGDTAEMRSARRERQAKAIAHLIRGAADNGLFLVMDYAEGREPEIKAIAAAIRSRPADDTRPIRLVLLTRGAGDWWTRLVEDDQIVRALFGGERLDVTALGGIASGKDRLDLFWAAAKVFGPKLAEMGYAILAADRSTPALTTRLQTLETNAGYQPGEGYDRPLAIAMEALLYLAAMAPGANEPGVHSLLANILGFERDHWSKLVGPLDPVSERNPRREMERAIAQITGVQGVESKRAAEDLFMVDARYPKRRGDRDSVDLLVDRVAKVYGRGDAIGQLEPDLIGEYHVGLVADRELLDGCVAWIATEAAELKRGAHFRDLITVLQRASRPEHGIGGVERACALLDHLIRQHAEALAGPMVAMMLDTPGALLRRLEAHVDTLSEPALAALNFALPIQNVSWMEFSLRVAERYVRLARNRTSSVDALDSPSTQLAAALNTLGNRLSNLGRREEALAASQEAVDNYRRLAADRPDAFLPDLASSLNNAGAMLSNLGRREEGLAASQEAVDIRRRLAADRPDAFLPDLAASLSNLGGDLSNRGRREEALAASEEAVKIRREALSRPATSLRGGSGAQSKCDVGRIAGLETLIRGCCGYARRPVGATVGARGATTPSS